MLLCLRIVPATKAKEVIKYTAKFVKRKKDNNTLVISFFTLHSTHASEFSLILEEKNNIFSGIQNKWKLTDFKQLS